MKVTKSWADHAMESHWARFFKPVYVDEGFRERKRPVVVGLERKEKADRMGERSSYWILPHSTDIRHLSHVALHKQAGKIRYAFWWSFFMLRHAVRLARFHVGGERGPS